MNATDWLLITAFIFSFFYGLMVMYFFIHWWRLKTYKPTGKIPDVSVSIIVPVRNEEKSIKQCLESLFAQNYPQHLFEVIVVDDYSTDHTRKIVRELTFPALRLFDLQQYLGTRGEKKPNKKEAISIGVKNAQGEIIVTTDGDCVRGENWLATMVEFFAAHNYKLLTAPVMIHPAYTPLQLLQMADVNALMGITGATIRAQLPTMCSGANLMYKKETFIEVDGFKGNHDVASGDDIFLMQKIQEKYPHSIGFLKNYDSCVFTQPEKGIFGFLGQRIRWISKTKHARWWVKAMLFFAYLFNLFVLLVAVYSLYGYFKTQDLRCLLPGIVAVGGKFFCDLLFCMPVFYFFKRLWLVCLFPMIEILHILYVVLVGWLSLSGRYRWRGRKVVG
jgi:cellulose synthase/poly-beta-1,6-N-acetylglucosamine synthase-like glycosyltransferase